MPLALAILALAPLAGVLTRVAVDPAASFTVLAAPATRTALRHTLAAGAGATAIATLLGGVMALACALTDLRLPRALGAVFVLLLLMPAQVTALAWTDLLSPSSPLLAPLGLAPRVGHPNPLFGGTGIALLLGIEQAPLVFLLFAAGLRAIPAAQVMAARSLGARPVRVLLRVVLPMAAPSLAAGVALAFVSAIGNFGIAALLGIPGRYPMLPTLIYQRLAGFGPSALGEVATLSLLLGAVAAAGLAVEAWLRRGAVPVPAAAPVRVRLGRLRGPASAALWLIALGLLALPLAALVATALVPAIGATLSAANATLGNLRAVVAEPAMRRALANSGLLAALAAAILLAAALLCGWLAAWRGSRLARAALAAADLPYVLPGMVLGIGCILLFLRPVAGIALYDTRWILLVAYLARFLTLAQRPVAAAWRSLDRGLDRAAAASGAGPWLRFRRVLLPHLAPAGGAAALVVFALAFNELTVSALLWSPGNETVGVAVFNLAEAGEPTQAAAASCISVATTLAVLGAAALLLRWRRRGAASS